MNKLVALLFTFVSVTFAQGQHSRHIIDVQRYDLNIHINDSTDTIHAVATIDLHLKGKISAYSLDLVDQKDDGKGMLVDWVIANNDTIPFQQQQNALIFSPEKFPVDSLLKLKISYSGIPRDGLIISKNIYKDRTFFGDNWPDRAHHWFPCNDHPIDKAFIRFNITCPSHYNVTANGRLIEKNELENTKNFIYETIVPIPTKVMVFGAAKFSVKDLNEVEGIPVSLWVYPDNSAASFEEYGVADDVLQYFVDKIGPYPYAKLANVQSTTRYGGMENAGNIFYSEQSFVDDVSSESLIAHEIAHQWFGNSASEKDWPHIWLSEGFATFLTNFYMYEKYGSEAYKKRLKTDRSRIIKFYNNYQHPVVDKSYKDLMDLLNPNSYQKGGWFLHMLRNEVGDELFWKGIRTYYRKYQLSNASTDNFIEVMEEVTGVDLKNFSHQWLKQAGHPILKIDTKSKGKALSIDVEQEQENEFKFDLEIKLEGKDGTTKKEVLRIDERKKSFALETDFKITSTQFDPEVKLLFEKITKK